MIVGQVDARRQSVIALRVRGPDGQERTTQAILDTGFNGALMLPPAQVAAQGLTIQDGVNIRMADGSRVHVPVYEATVVWGGVERRTTVIASGSQPLLGTSLLLGHRLSIDLVVGGHVTIQSLPPDAVPWFAGGYFSSAM